MSDIATPSTGGRDDGCQTSRHLRRGVEAPARSDLLQVPARLQALRVLVAQAARDARDGALRLPQRVPASAPRLARASSVRADAPVPDGAGERNVSGPAVLPRIARRGGAGAEDV